METKQNPGTLLIVDDSSDNLLLLSEVFTPEGYTIRTAKNGPEALEEVNRELPDLILLDVKLPGINGFEVCAALKANPKTKAVPVIFITAMTEKSEKLKGFKAGGSDFISKPFFTEEVILRVKTHLENYRMHALLNIHTQALQFKNKQLGEEITERDQAYAKLHQTYCKLEKSEIATLNIMDDLRLETDLRLKNQAALAQSSEKFLNLANSIEAFIAYVNADTLTYEFVNQSFAKSFGIPAGKIIGSHIKEIMGEPNYQFALEFINQVKQGKPVTYENSFNLVTGKRWVQVNYSPIFDSYGKVTSIAVLSNDITQRKLAEEETKLNAKRLKILVDVLQYQAGSVQEFLDYSLNLAIELTNSKIGYIYHYDEEKKKFVLNSWSKEVMKECSIREPQTCYELDKTGLWGEAVRQRKPILINDFQATHPLKKGYPDGHAPLNKYLTLPIFNNNQIVGVVAVANKETDYTDKDTAQLILLMEVVWKVVERRQADDKLKESELKLREAQEMAHLGYWNWDINTGKVEWSDEVFKIFGFVPQEFAPHIDSILALSPWPEDHQRDRELINRAMESRKPGSYEQKFLRPDKSIGHYYSTFQGNYNLNGELISIVGTILDITGRKLAEETLLQSEEKFSKAFKTAPYAITITRPDDGRFIETNDAFTTISGYTREETLADSSIGMKLWKNEEDRNRVLEILRTGLSVNSIEFQFRTKSGKIITGLFSAQVIKLSSGTCILSSINDISERKQMLDQLQKTNQRLDTLLSSLYAGVLTTSKDGEVEHVNQAFCNLFNLSESPGSLQGLSSPDIIKKIADRYANPEATIARIQKLTAEGKPVKGEEIAMRDQRYFLVDFIPIIDKNGNKCGRIWHHQDITGRKQAEEELKESETRFRGMFENSIMGVSTATPEGNLIDANLAYAQMYGYANFKEMKKELKNIKQLYANPEDRKEVLRILAEKGIMKPKEFELVKRDGTKFFALVSAMEVKDVNGKLLYNQANHIDITELKLAEKALMENSIKLELAMQAANMAWWEMDINTGKVRFEKRKADMLGYSPEKFNHYTDFMALVHPEDHESTMDAMRGHLDGLLSRYEVEYRILTQSGEYKWFYDIGSIVKKDPEGKPLSIAGIVIDITKRKQIESALVESEAIFRSFMENSPIYVFFKDKDIRAIRLSKNYETMLGKPLQELLGKNMEDFFPSELAKKMVDDDRLILKEGKLVTVDEELNGRFYTTIKFPVKIEGKPRYLAGYTIDITESKKIKEKLQFQNTILLTQQEASIDGILIVDQNSNIISYNNRFVEIWGILPELLKNTGSEPFLQLVMDKVGDTKSFLQQVQYLNEHKLETSRDDIIFKDGRTFDRYSAPMIGNDSIFYGRVWYFRDITESKLAEEALQASKDYLDKIINAVASPIFVKDNDHKFCLVNDALCSLLGLPSEKLIGKTGLEHFPDDQVAVFISKDKEVLNTGIENINEEFITNGLGNIRTIVTRKTLYTDSSGNKFLVGVINDITERKLAEEKLQNSEMQYRSLAENSPDHIARFDHQYQYLYVNKKAALAGPYTPEEYKGKTLIEVGFPEQVSREWEDRIKTVFETGNSLDLENSFETPDGLQYFSTKFVPEFNPDGSILSVQSIARDITKNKQDENELKRQRETLQIIFDHIPVMIAYFDKSGKISLANNELIVKLGWSFEEWQNENILLKCYPKPEDYSQLIEFMNSKPKGWKDFKTSTKQGNVMDTLWTNIPLSDGFSMGIGQDITEQKRATEALNNERTLLRTLIDNIPDAIFTKDLECRKTLVNLADINNLGAQSESDVLGKNDFELFPKELAENFFMDDMSVLQTGNPVLNREEYVFDHKGEKQWLLTSKLPLRDQQGRIIGLVGIGRDITLRIKAEQALSLLNEELEQRVIERTAQLEAANKELEAFSYSVSHDLRSPLRHISGFIKIFIDEKTTQLTEQELGRLTVVTEAAQKMGELIDALLVFSRLNQNEIRKNAIDTVGIINQGLQTFELEMQTRSIELKIGSLHQAFGDNQLISQVWANLLSNAIKYTGKKDKAFIEIGSYDENNQTVFFIKDNGAGFDMQYYDKLFGVFQRLHRPTDFEGIGIGLANVNRIIVRHGGRCWAEGKTGVGATFYFSLPKENS